MTAEQLKSWERYYPGVAAPLKESFVQGAKTYEEMLQRRIEAAISIVGNTELGKGLNHTLQIIKELQPA